MSDEDYENYYKELGYYDRQGEQISFKEWSKLHGDRDYCILRQERFAEYFISTVWLGLDHSFESDRPIIFETMVFKNSEGVEQIRYSTEAEALAGHERACEELKLLSEAFSR